ncbi:MAG: LysR family transcriptional regulator [Thermococcus sp.]|nr:LysR family transcriptional regulator [Thermococcus sp.]
MLPLESLEVLKKYLEDFRFDDGIITCPNPLLHPKIDVIIDGIRDLCRKTTLFLPVSVSRTMLRKTSLENVEFISLLISSFKEIKSNFQTLKMLLSQGIDNLEAYVILDSSYDFAEILSIIKFCTSFGLSITIGPRMYERPYTDEFIEKLVKKENVEIGLHYGKKYFYNAIKVFVNEYPVTVLTSSAIEKCKALYLNPYGTLSKCPLSHYEVNYKKITREDLRKMLFSPCVIRDRTLSFSPHIEISFITNEGIKISGDILELLELISQVNSFRAACKTLGVSPSTYWEKIKSLEERIGAPLLLSTRGGGKKGVTIPTEFARKLLHEYRKVREKIIISLNGQSVLIELGKF